MSLFLCDRVLVPIDFSDVSWNCLAQTLDFVPDTAKVYSLYVLPRLLAIEPGVIWETVNDSTRIENVKMAFYERYPEDSRQNLHFDVTIGDPGAEIIDYANNHQICLIIIASHGTTGLHRFLLGSVAEKVVRFAQCPVLVWR